MAVVELHPDLFNKVARISLQLKSLDKRPFLGFLGSVRWLLSSTTTTPVIGFFKKSATSGNCQQPNRKRVPIMPFLIFIYL